MYLSLSLSLSLARARALSLCRWIIRVRYPPMLRVLQMSDLTREQPRMNRDQMLGTVRMSKETYFIVQRYLL
jgi:hypothetical protein